MVPGLLVTLGAALTVDIGHPDLTELKDADYLGMLFMAIFLGMLEYVLKEGARWNWFDDYTVRYLMTGMTHWLGAVLGSPEAAILRH